MEQQNCVSSANSTTNALGNRKSTEVFLKSSIYSEKTLVSDNKMSTKVGMDTLNSPPLEGFGPPNSLTKVEEREQKMSPPPKERSMVGTNYPNPQE